MDTLLGQKLGQYEILEEIGRGGMGVVYKGYQPSLNRHVAIKVLPAHLTVSKELVQRFLREATTAGRLHHPNIVTIYDVAQQDSTYYIAMEYVDGKSLKQMIQESGSLPLETVAKVLTQVTSALDYAHKRGIIHRDIKPSNVLFDSTGRPILVDFGIAKAGDATSLTQEGRSLGTVEYMAPEVADGRAATAASDIYSLGVMLYELVVGRVPFKADTPYAVLLGHISKAPPSPRSILPSLPEAVEAVLLKALAKDPASRYATALDIAREFEQAIHGAPVPVAVTLAPQPSVPAFELPFDTLPEEPQPGALKTMIIAAVIGGVLALVVMGTAAAWYFLFR
jgi:serine/threonine-protein kinase